MYKKKYKKFLKVVIAAARLHCRVRSRRSSCLLKECHILGLIAGFPRRLVGCFRRFVPKLEIFSSLPVFVGPGRESNKVMT